MLFFGAVSYIWFYHGSLDGAVRALTPQTAPPASAITIPAGADFAVIDGIRWFRLIGTDSAGMGYNGWVSEMAFREVPPEPSGASGTDAILQKIGLPTAAETAKAAKQMKKITEQLRLQNRLNRGN